MAKVDGREWDLLRPLEGDCALQLLGFDSPDGKDVRLPMFCIVLSTVRLTGRPMHAPLLTNLLVLQGCWGIGTSLVVAWLVHL